jgi:protein-L-isoaspartate(D-aspartate) O-methyltransferase
MLAELAKEVYTIERFPELSRQAAGLLAELGYTNIHFKAGDGSVGWKEHAPFDRIIITAACPRVPFPLEEQLREGGRIVLPVGADTFRQQLQVCEKNSGRLSVSFVCDCVFVPLVGEFGMFKK